MAKIYTFPQGAERRKLQKKIQWDRDKHLTENGWQDRNKGKATSNLISATWYYVRFATAAALHITSVCTLAVLAAFSNGLFWIGGLVCVVTWFTNDHQFWSANNFTIPVVASLWLLSLVAAPLIDFLNVKLPFYRLIVPDSKQSKDVS